MYRPRPCRSCDRVMDRHPGMPQGGRTHLGRGLCSGCYKREEGAGTLSRYSRMRCSRANLVDQYLELVQIGLKPEVIASDLGLKLSSLARALRRARDAGDHRIGSLPSVPRTRRS